MAVRTVNKSAAVREILERNPEMSPKEVVGILAGRGINVTAQLVSNVKTREGKGSSTPARRGRPPAKNGVAAPTVARRTVADVTFSTENMVNVKRLASELGGFAQLREVMDAVEQLVEA